MTPVKKRLTMDDFYRTGGEWKNPLQNQLITETVIDSREVVPGSVFFALPGEKTDGHKYIGKAIESGASIVVYSDPDCDREFLGTDCVGIRTDNVIQYMQDLAHRVIKKSRIPVVAITGSNGKTTTREMVAAVLSAKFRVHKNYKNLNNHLGVPITILNVNREHDFLVLEMGMNHYGEIARLCEIADPTAGLITNIGSAHIEFFGSVENIAKAKGELFAYLKSKRGFVFINADDPNLLRQMVGGYTQALYFGLRNKEATIRAREIAITETNTYKFTWLDQKTSKTGKIILKIPGYHMVSNALAAVAVGVKYNVRPEDINLALSNYTETDKRMQMLELSGRTVIVDCYNANPDSMKAGIQSFHEMRFPGKKILVLGDMFELGKRSADLHETIGKFIAPLPFDGIITIGKESSSISGYLKRYESNLGVHHFEAKEPVMGWLESTLKPGDAVYLKASRGMKLEEISNFLIETYSAGEA